jgi:DNA-binding XRE family transcriptional regulator
MSEERLGERVKAARLAQQMTMAELAKGCGLTKGFISQLESSASNPSLNTLRKIADALNVPVMDLLDTPHAHGIVEFIPTEMRRPTILHGEYGLPGEPGISVLSSGPDGTHSLVTMSQGGRLLHVENAGENGKRGNAVVTVLAGKISVVQEHDELVLTRGGVASWDSGSSYTIDTAGPAGASLVLFTPHGCAVPTYQRNRSLIQTSTPQHAVSLVAARSAGMLDRKRVIPANRQGKGSNTHRTGTAEGPLRLVAMRAQRLAARRGQS